LDASIENISLVILDAMPFQQFDQLLLKAPRAMMLLLAGDVPFHLLGVRSTD